MGQVAGAVSVPIEGEAGVNLLAVDPNWADGKGQDTLFSLDFSFHPAGQIGPS